MKRTDGLFEKSVSCKSRYIPAQYHRRIADTLNSLPDVILCDSEETPVHVIIHRRNYRFISAVSAAGLILISVSAYLRFGNASGDSHKNNEPKTTFRVTRVMITSSDQYENHKEPLVTYQISLSQSDNKTSGSQTNNDTQDHDTTGNTDLINKNSAVITKLDSGKENNNAAVTENKKAQNTRQPADKLPSPPDKNSAVTAPGSILSDNEKVNGKDNDIRGGKWGNEIEEIRENDLSGHSDPFDNGKYQEESTPEHFTGGNSVGSKPAGLPENMEKEAGKIQKEIKMTEIIPEKAPDAPDPYLPDIPEYENQFSYPHE